MAHHRIRRQTVINSVLIGPSVFGLFLNISIFTRDSYSPDINYKQLHCYSSHLPNTLFRRLSVHKYSGGPRLFPLRHEHPPMRLSTDIAPPNYPQTGCNQLHLLHLPNNSLHMSPLQLRPFPSAFLETKTPDSYRLSAAVVGLVPRPTPAASQHGHSREFHRQRSDSQSQ